MNTAFFFQTQQIPDSSSIFDQFKQQNIFFSYFQVDQKYYLFFYSLRSYGANASDSQKSIDIHFLYQFVTVIQELDSKQRKIRSLRGFFLYALEITENGKDYEILETNLQPFFWRKVKNIIRQNKKAALQKFLFNTAEVNQDLTVGSISYSDIKDKIQNLQNQVNSLQQKVIQLEAKLDNPKYALSGTLEAPDATKTSQQDYYPLKPNKGVYSLENNPNFQQVEEPRNEISKSVSEASKSPLKRAERSEEYNINTTQNRANFITLGKIY